jgi:hypothetical protein
MCVCVCVCLVGRSSPQWKSGLLFRVSGGGCRFILGQKREAFRRSYIYMRPSFVWHGGECSSLHVGLIDDWTPIVDSFLPSSFVWVRWRRYRILGP